MHFVCSVLNRYLIIGICRPALCLAYIAPAFSSNTHLACTPCAVSINSPPKMPRKPRTGANSLAPGQDRDQGRDFSGSRAARRRGRRSSRRRVSSSRVRTRVCVVEKSVQIFICRLYALRLFVAWGLQTRFGFHINVMRIRIYDDPESIAATLTFQIGSLESTRTHREIRYISNLLSCTRFNSPFNTQILVA